MYIESVLHLQGQKCDQWQTLLHREGLTVETIPEETVLVWEDDKLIATGSRDGNVLKYLAVDSAYRGQDLTASVLTNLRQNAFRAGFDQLFLYTKPENEWMFTSLFFHSVAKTKNVLLMESNPSGIQSFLSSLPEKKAEGKIGSLVMNCNPFTKGHLYLAEFAAKTCDWVYVFVLSEDKSEFSAKDRLEMVKLGTTHIPNLTVLPTGPYLISAATFPTYFIKDRNNAENVQCLLDIAVFCDHFVPKYHITHRFVGTEPNCLVTDAYNRALAENLPGRGICLEQIPRLEIGGQPVSASTVRALLKQGHLAQAKAFLPETTWNYLQTNGLCK